MSQDDNILLEMISDSSQKDAGFRLLTQQYGKALYWHIRRIVVGHDDAEDVLQNTFIKIYNQLSRFKGEGKLSTWMYTIATNEALQHLRKQKRFLQSIDALGDTLCAKLKAEQPIDSDSAENIFQQAILQLPTQQRIAFNMRYYDELSYEEIAEITKKNVGTLKVNYHFATERIKQYIKEHTL
ncbi:RNA polymerase sigma factor [Prevotella sp. Rep29]|uniref:RNA polymerase sigma factor n=1 Tax=Prevotella sp. Rep29 TaxID=2691580 RepID=UPI00210317D2|nr:RNA polymerase sigma factor [Prevotella sp. Rep29]